MRTGTYYLNNHGSKWIHLTNGQKDKISLQTATGKTITRTVIYYESFGNFGSCLISYKGKKISVLADSILPD